MSKKKKNKGTPVPEEIKETAEAVEAKAEETAAEAVEEVKDAVIEAAEAAKDAKEETEEASEAVEEVKEEAAEAVEEAKSDAPAHAKKKAKKDGVSPVRLAVVLTVICVAVALLLGAVNHFTADKIAENNEKSMLSSITEIFDPSVGVKKVDDVSAYDGVTALYLVTKSDKVCGLAAASCPAGFGGDISMITGLDSEGKVVGVRIIAMSETPGIGEKTKGEDFLAQFTGLSGSAKLGEGVDAISGATISSTAVTKGVDTVLAAVGHVAAVAAANGMGTIPYEAEATTEEVTTVPETEPITAAPETSAPVETTVPVDGSVKKTDVPAENVENPNNEKPPYDGAVSETDTAEYTTLTTEHTTVETSSVSETSAPSTTK